MNEIILWLYNSYTDVLTYVAEVNNLFIAAGMQLMDRVYLTVDVLHNFFNLDKKAPIKISYLAAPGQTKWRFFAFYKHFTFALSDFRWPFLRTIINQYKLDAVLLVLPTALLSVWMSAWGSLFFISTQRNRITLLLLLFWITFFCFWVDFVVFNVSVRTATNSHASWNQQPYKLNTLLQKGIVPNSTITMPWTFRKSRGFYTNLYLNTFITAPRRQKPYQYYYGVLWKKPSFAEPTLWIEQIKKEIVTTHRNSTIRFPFLFGIELTSIIPNSIIKPTIWNLYNWTETNNIFNLTRAKRADALWYYRTQRKLMFETKLLQYDSKNTTLYWDCFEKSINVKESTPQNLKMLPIMWYLDALQDTSLKKKTEAEFAFSRIFGQDAHLTGFIHFPFIFIATVGSIFIILFSNPSQIFNSTTNEHNSLISKKVVDQNNQLYNYMFRYLFPTMYKFWGGVGLMEMLSLDLLAYAKSFTYQHSKLTLNKYWARLYPASPVFGLALLTLLVHPSQPFWSVILFFFFLILVLLNYTNAFLKWQQYVSKTDKATFKICTKKNDIILALFLVCYFVNFVNDIQINFIFFLSLWVFWLSTVYVYYNFSWMRAKLGIYLSNLGFISVELTWLHSNKNLYFEYFNFFFLPVCLLWGLLVLRLWQFFFAVGSFASFASYFLFIMPLISSLVFIFINNLSCPKYTKIWGLLCVAELIQVCFIVFLKHWRRGTFTFTKSVKTIFFYFYLTIYLSFNAIFTFLPKNQMQFFIVFLLFVYFTFIVFTLLLSQASSMAQSDNIDAVKGSLTALKYSTRLWQLLIFGLVLFLLFLIWTIICI